MVMFFQNKSLQNAPLDMLKSVLRASATNFTQIPKTIHKGENFHQKIAQNAPLDTLKSVWKTPAKTFFSKSDKMLR